MKKVLSIAMMTLMAVAITHAAGEEDASEKKSYLGLGYQGATYNEDGFDETINMNGAYISYGASVIPWLDLELQLGFLTGSLDEANYAGTGVDIESTLTGVNIDILAQPTYTIEQFSVYGMLGLSMLFTSIDVEGTMGSVSESETTTDSTFGFILGAGVAYDFGKFGVNAEISTYQYSDYDLTPLYSIGGRYNF